MTQIALTQLSILLTAHVSSVATTSLPSAAHVVTSLQGALNQHPSAPVQPPGTNPTASPRPSILRKRPAEG